MPTTAPDPEDLLFCNCAGCGVRLLSASVENQILAARLYPDPRTKPQTVAARRMELGWDRPYCEKCLRGQE